MNRIEELIDNAATLLRLSGIEKELISSTIKLAYIQGHLDEKHEENQII